jgi:predicted neuraminidase
MRHPSTSSPWLTIAVAGFLLLLALRLSRAQGLASSAGVLTGVWQCELSRADGEMPFALDISQSAGQITGRVSSPEGELTIAAATFRNGVISIQLPSPEGIYILSAKSTAQALTDGRVTLDGKFYGTWHGEKAPPPGSSAGIGSLADGRIRPASMGGLREAYLPIAFPSSHAANLIALRNGDLLCTWYTGLWEGHSNVAIAISQLRKGSREWTRPGVVAQKEGYAFENPVLFEPADGALWLFHTSQIANAGQANSQIFLLTSSDAGRHWTQPKLLFAQPGSFERQRLLATGSTWVFPMYYTPSRGITGEDALRNYSTIQISADQGRTWKECAVPESQGLVQPDVIELSPEHFEAFFRSRWADWVYTSYSRDGCSWTAPTATRIPNNNSSIQVFRLDNGRLVIAFNNRQAATKRAKSTTAPRWPLSVALSADSGQTWPWVRDVETGSEVPIESLPDAIAGTDVERERGAFFDHLYSYEYPSIIQTSDGIIHMAYTFRRRTIKYIAFDENWIKGGSTKGIFKGDRPQ